MVRCNPGTHREFTAADSSSSDGWAGLRLDSCSYLVLSRLLQLRLFERWSPYAACRDRVHGSPTTNHDLLHDHGSLLARALLPGPVRPDLWRSRAGQRACNSNGKPLGLV